MPEPEPEPVPVPEPVPEPEPEYELITDPLENRLLYWSQDTTDDNDWTFNSGKTPSSGTGPDGAYKDTYYLYTEASGYLNKEFRLISNKFIVNRQNSAFHFWYHMYGSNMGSLTIYIRQNGSNTEKLVISGQQQTTQSKDWIEGTVKLGDYKDTGYIQLVIEGKTGSYFRSDIAIDELALRGIGFEPSPEPEPEPEPEWVVLYENPDDPTLQWERSGLNYTKTVTLEIGGIPPWEYIVYSDDLLEWQINMTMDADDPRRRYFKTELKYYG